MSGLAMVCPGAAVEIGLQYNIALVFNFLIAAAQFLVLQQSQIEKWRADGSAAWRIVLYCIVSR